MLECFKRTAIAFSTTSEVGFVATLSAQISLLVVSTSKPSTWLLTLTSPRMPRLTFTALVDPGDSAILGSQSISSTGMTVSTFTTSSVISVPKSSLFRRTLTRSSTSTTRQRISPDLSQTSKQTARQRAVSRQRVIPLLAISQLNKAATNELEVQAITMVAARTVQARPKVSGNHKINVKVKASLGAMADTNRRIDEEVAKANDRMVMKVSEVVVLKARQLNRLISPFIQTITGRAVFDIVHIRFFSISCNRLEAKPS
jgi:hypothetical protein